MAALTLMPSQEKSVRVCCRREERGWYLGTPRSAILTSSEGLPDSHREVDLPEAEKDLSVYHWMCVSGIRKLWSVPSTGVVGMLP